MSKCKQCGNLKENLGWGKICECPPKRKCASCGKTVGDVKNILDADGKCWMCTNAF